MREAADRLGVSVATVCYQVSYVRRLPTSFVSWLESGGADILPNALAERRLREIAKLSSDQQSLEIENVMAKSHCPRGPAE